MYEYYRRGGTFVEGEVSNEKKTILIVDDEQPIIDMLVYNLEKEGYNTLEATDGEKAVDIALNNTPDLILLDIMIPKMDGLSVCKRIRHNLNVPIIMLSAKGEEIDKILGLELGADDYITKPFSIRELMARIKANLRKAKGSYEEGKLEANTNKIVVGNLQLDIDKFETRVKNKVVDLTLREFEVLKYLANQLGQVVTRETLLEKVWGYEYYGDIRTVDVTVRRIREKIEEDTSNPKILITKRGVGYYIPTANKIKRIPITLFRVNSSLKTKTPITTAVSGSIAPKIEVSVGPAYLIARTKVILEIAVAGNASPKIISHI